MPKLRLGVDAHPDARPLAWGFLKGHHADLFSPAVHPSGLVAQLFDQGVLDVGLLSTLDALTLGDLVLLPDLCLTAPAGGSGPVLLLRGEPGSVCRLAHDHTAPAAVAAARIVLAEVHGRRVETAETVATTHADADGSIPDGADAVLWSSVAALGSDPELSEHSEPPEGTTVLDLEAAWRSLTGRPLVLSLWAARRAVDLPDLPFYFKSSLRLGLASRQVVARELAAETGVDSGRLEERLGRVGYFLRDDELAGVEELGRRAAALGLVAEGLSRPPLWTA